MGPRVLIIKSACRVTKTCEYNRGSFAVLKATVDTVNRYAPEAELSTLIQISEDNPLRTKLRVIEHSPSDYRYYSISDSISMDLNIIRCILWRTLRKIKPDIDLFKNNVVVRAFDAADVVIDLSLDAYSDDYGTRSIIETSKEIMMGVILGKPVYIFAQSLGPFENKINRFITRFVLSHACIITAREEISYQYVQELHLHGPDIYLTADMAFLLNPTSPQRLSQILNKEGIYHQRPIVGIALSKMKEVNQGSNSFTKFLMSLYSVITYLLPEKALSYLQSHIKRSRIFQRVESNVGKSWANDVIKHLVHHYGATVILIPHIISSQKELMGDDRTTVKNVFDAIEIDDKDGKVIPILDAYSSEELKGIIGTCDIFIGEKMHANVGALSQCVPTVGLSYSHKFLGIMKLLGQEEYVVSSLDSKEIISKVDKLWENKEQIRSELRSRVGYVKKRALYNTELLVDLLKK